MKYLEKIIQLGIRESIERVQRRVNHRIRLFLHLPVRLKSVDRNLLDNKILPWFARQDYIQKVLFVGCEYYTVHYPGIFSNTEFWTIEPDRVKSKYGSKNHIVGFLQDLCQFVPANSFDLIIFNGVYGWGLNTREDIEGSFDACFSCLKTGGFLIFGWNNIEERIPVPLKSIKALELFQPFIIPGIGGPRIETNSHNKHVFDFYRKIQDISN
jgi:hypothetical protein